MLESISTKKETERLTKQFLEDNRVTLECNRNNAGHYGTSGVPEAIGFTLSNLRKEKSIGVQEIESISKTLTDRYLNSLTYYTPVEGTMIAKAVKYTVNNIQRLQRFDELFTYKETTPKDTEPEQTTTYMKKLWVKIQKTIERENKVKYLEEVLGDRWGIVLYLTVSETVDHLGAYKEIDKVKIESLKLEVSRRVRDKLKWYWISYGEEGKDAERDEIIEKIIVTSYIETSEWEQEKKE